MDLPSGLDCVTAAFTQTGQEREKFRIGEKNRAFTGRGISHLQAGLTALRGSLAKGRVDGGRCWQGRV